MTDREYLELAAKAAGHTLIWGEKYKLGEDLVDCTDLAYIRSGQPDEGDLYWNPLTDDGDALRLMVRLRLHARQFPILDDGFDAPLGMVEMWRVDDDDPLHVEFLRNGDDRLCVTRRAIVRAAAEIGKGTKQFPTAKEIREEWT